MHIPEQDLKKQTTELQDLLKIFLLLLTRHQNYFTLNRDRHDGEGLILCGSEMCLGCIDVVYRELVRFR